MIDQNMDSLVAYLMKMRGEGAPNPMMPPQQAQPEINPAVAGIMNMLQGQQQQNPLSSLLAQSQSPSPNILGSGAANIAGNLLELQRMAKEAALNGDFEKADAIAKKIQELQSQQK